MRKGKYKYSSKAEDEGGGGVDVGPIDKLRSGLFLWPIRTASPPPQEPAMLIGQLTDYEQFSVQGKPVLSYVSEPYRKT